MRKSTAELLVAVMEERPSPQRIDLLIEKAAYEADCEMRDRVGEFFYQVEVFFMKRMFFYEGDFFSKRIFFEMFEKN